MAKTPAVPTDLDVSNSLETHPNISVEELEASYFIKYEPELAETFSQQKSTTVSVSGRCLSIVYSRLNYWSRYAKHRFKGKLFFWKSQKELSEETGFSIKQINRSLKALVELGMIVREKFHKKYWRQTYFYHLPLSRFTKEMDGSPRPGTSSLGSCRGGTPQQLQERDARGAIGGPQGASPIGAPTTAPMAAGAPAPATYIPSPQASRKISGGKGFGRKGAKCPTPTQEQSTSIKQTLQSIVEKCQSYGNEDIYRERFGLS